MRYLALLALIFTACATKRVPQTSPGEARFQTYCAGCHESDGRGSADAPPLADSAWITGPPDRIIAIVLHGVRGRMMVAGTAYDREMPGFGHRLPDDEVAAVVTYIRERFGPKASPIGAPAVHRVREANAERTQYWTADELLSKF